MALTAEQIRQIIIDEGIAEGEAVPSLASIQTELDGIDQGALQTTEEAKYTVSLWDKVSSINGVSANEIFARRADFDRGSPIVLITEVATGRVLQVQPHKAGVGGLTRYADDTEATTEGNTLRTTRAESAVHRSVLQQVLSNLGLT